MIRRLDIWWDGRIVGQVMQNRHGELGFGYAAAWVADESAPALSAWSASPITSARSPCWA